MSAPIKAADLPTEYFTIILAVVDTFRSPVYLVLNDTVWRHICGPAGYVPAAAIESFTVVSRPEVTVAREVLAEVTSILDECSYLTGPDLIRINAKFGVTS